MDLKQHKTTTPNLIHSFQWVINCFLILLIASCGNESPHSNQENEKADQPEIRPNDESTIYEPFEEEKGEIKVVSAPQTERFSEAKLSLKAPAQNDLKPGLHSFEFEVENYELKAQTAMRKKHSCANSDKGQHLHFILNNAPYRAEYSPQFKAELSEGNNVVLAFLSRSFHESIKTQSAYVLKNFVIGDPFFEFDENAPHLFYSRPKGQYKGAETKNILLDFYLINTELSKDGNQVRLSIDNTQFMLPHWQAYFVQGLSKGKHDFRIELLDANGQLIEGPFNNSGVRSIELL